MKWFALVMIIMTDQVAAQQQIPDEQTKIKALQFAFIANGCSMTGTGSLDVSKETYVHDPKISPKTSQEIERICQDLKASEARTQQGHQ